MNRRDELHHIDRELRRIHEEKERLRHGPPPARGSHRDRKLHELERRERDLHQRKRDLGH